MTKRLTKEEFITRAYNVHGNTYGYDNVIYINNRTKIKIECDVHGIFEQLPFSHLSGDGCKKCYNERIALTKEEFITRAINTHGNYYDYSNVIYKNNYTKISIKCKVHGLFDQLPSHHINGSGCSICNTSGITKERFIKISNDKECTFYIIKCFNDSESFYKIGITAKSIISRFKNKSYMPYDYVILKEIKGSADYVWNIESKLKNNLKSIYNPCITFSGSYGECFTDLKEIENNLNETIDYLNKHDTMK